MYEQVAEVKVNFDKSKGLRLSAWEGWSSPIWIFPLERESHRYPWGDVQTGYWWYWSEVQTKVGAQVGNGLRRRLSLKSRIKASSPWSFTDCPYSPCLRFLEGAETTPLRIDFGEVVARWSVDRGEAPFFAECHKALRNLRGFSELSRSRKELYQELVVGTASDPMEKRLGWSQFEIRSKWNWAPGSDFLNNSELLSHLAVRLLGLTEARRICVPWVQHEIGARWRSQHKNIVSLSLCRNL